jgi:hypothetical protein
MHGRHEKHHAAHFIQVRSEEETELFPFTLYIYFEYIRIITYYFFMKSLLKTKYPIERFVDTFEDPAMIPNKISEGLNQTVIDFADRYKTLDETKASQRPFPEKWSRKEILGHLIDSAANNHQRFVRVQYLQDKNFLAYDQQNWVKIQQYSTRTWIDVLEFWKLYNLHLAHVISHIPLECLQASGTIGESGPVTIGYVVMDYLGHVQHHLRQIERM